MFGELYTIHMANHTEMGQNSISQIPVKSEHGYSPKYAEHVFSVIGLSLCCHGHDHKMRQITNCDGSVAICDCRNFWRFKTQLLRLISIVTEGIAPKFRKHIHIKIGPVQEGFLCTTIISFMTYMHTHKQINQWNNTKMGKNKLFIFMSKMNLGTLPSTQNTFSVLLDSVYAVMALITNCDKSQIATARIPGLSQFVTVAICDGSKHNFSDRFHGNRGYTPKCRKHIHNNIGPFQEGFLGTSIMSFITDKHTHKHIYQWNNTKRVKIQLFIFMSKVNMSTLPSTQNTFSVLFDSVCAVTALITNCDKSQIATVVSQFVTVVICDGSKYNFSDWC